MIQMVLFLYSALPSSVRRPILKTSKVFVYTQLYTLVRIVSRLQLLLPCQDILTQVFPVQPDDFYTFLPHTA